MEGPIEKKVTAATLAALLTSIVANLVDHYVFKDAGVPAFIYNIIEVLLITVLTWVAGYMAKHTPRSDLHPPV